MKNKFIQQLQEVNNLKKTTNGANAYKSTLNANLDLFALTLHSEEDVIKEVVNKAYFEDKNMCFKNILHILDIREGKGFRKVFKTLIKELIVLDLHLAYQVIKHIPELGRWDYFIEILTHTKNSLLNTYLKTTIKKQWEADLINFKKQKEISLLAKWLPSLRTHKKNNHLAHKLALFLCDSYPTYRKTLKQLRDYLNIVETKLTNKLEIDFSKVPSKAHIMYSNTFLSKDIYSDKYQHYLQSLKNNKAKVNLNNLFFGDIVKKCYEAIHYNPSIDIQQQMDVLWEKLPKSSLDNTMVVADTSGSMEGTPLYNALGLAYMLSTQSQGLFKNKFITFSRVANFVNLKGNKLSGFIKQTKEIVENTNLESVLNLLLLSAVLSKCKQSELPKYLLFATDGEFDEMVDQAESVDTIFKKYQKDYKNFGYKMPFIIFWNMGHSQSFPILKSDKNILLISGYSKNLIEELNTIGINALTNYSPVKLMEKILSKYDKYLV